MSTGQCLACMREYQARYTEADRDGRNAKQRLRYAANPDLYRAHSARYYIANRERLAAYKQEYNRANIDRWRQIDATRRADDLVFRIKKALRARLGSALKRNTKTGSAIRDLGCTIEELKAYLAAQFRDGMTWGNWPAHWQIDHIQPLARFDLTDPAQFAAACHHTNLQPLLVSEHRQKSGMEK